MPHPNRREFLPEGADAFGRQNRLCVDKIGMDNVMWAIDYPYQPTAGAVAFIETAATVTEDERVAVAHGNAERIFRIAAG